MKVEEDFVDLGDGNKIKVNSRHLIIFISLNPSILEKQLKI